ncbi:hypothetical protein BVV20_10500 [Xanthomonas oryzae pv. oryzae]|nr:hypothetical protein BVV20_10500 [Xanthomonas oryzae pv. oryzae]
MICSSEKRFFTSNLLGIGNWTPNWGATQNRGDVGHAAIGSQAGSEITTAAVRGRCRSISQPESSEDSRFPNPEPQ